MTKPKLLVVEDDGSTRKVWEIVFGRRGWDVAVAATLAEGLRLFDLAPDYLILDLLLPDGGGEAILRKVRKLGLTTRVAVTPGIDDPHQMSRIYSLCPEAMFEKPIDVADLWPLRGGARSAGVAATVADRIL